MLMQESLSSSPGMQPRARSAISGVLQESCSGYAQDMRGLQEAGPVPECNITSINPHALFCRRTVYKTDCEHKHKGDHGLGGRFQSGIQTRQAAETRGQVFDKIGRGQSRVKGHNRGSRMLRGLLLVAWLAPYATEVLGFVPSLKASWGMEMGRGLRCKLGAGAMMMADGRGGRSNVVGKFAREEDKDKVQKAGEDWAWAGKGALRMGTESKDESAGKAEEREDLTDVTGARDLNQLLNLCKIDEGVTPERTAQSYQRLKEFRKSKTTFTPDEYKTMNQILQICDDQALKSMDSFIPRHMAMLMHCHASMGKNPERNLFEALERQAVEQKEYFKPQNIANIFWSCATLARQPSTSMLFEMSKRAEDVMEDFSPKEISNLIWSFARLNRQPSDYLFSKLCNRTSDSIQDFKPQGLSNFMWACGKLSRRPPQDSFVKICDRAGASVAFFKPQEIANFIWGCATLGMHPSGPLFDKMCDRAKVTGQAFKSQEIANFLWACAKLGLQPTDTVFTAMCEQAESQIEQFRPQGISNLVWASATIKRRLPDSLFDQFCTKAEKMMYEFMTQEISNFLWACANLATRPSTTLMNKMCSRAAVLIQDFKPQGIAGFCWSCATLGLQPPESLLKKLCHRASETISDFNSQGIANLLWSFAVFGRVSEGLEFLVQLQNRVGLNGSSFDSWDDVALCQTYQFLLSYELDPNEVEYPQRTRDFVAEIKKTIRARCMQSFSEQGTPSRLQNDVAATVKQLGFRFEEHAFDAKSGYCINILIRQEPLPVAMEVDGPTRFLSTGKEATGATLLKRRHLKLLGYRTVCVPYWEWNSLVGVEKEDFIRVLLTVKT